MRASHQPQQRPAAAKLLIVDPQGELRHSARSTLIDHLRPGDLLVANDAATLPASLHGIHGPSGEPIEVRLAGRSSMDFDDVRDFTVIVFGAGDFHTRTEDRPMPPKLRVGDRLILGPLRATVKRRLGHARWVKLAFEGPPHEVWAGIASHGRPIQYAHIRQSLDLWDVWTPVATRAVAFESPSAGFVLNWSLLDDLSSRGVDFATLTLAAGISSTGDPALDARLPLDEPYFIPEATVKAVTQTRAKGGRVISLGTTVTRALEHSAGQREGLSAGPGLATQRLGPTSEIGIVDAILTGTHEPEESHYQLLHAFADGDLLQRITAELEGNQYRTHEFGDSLLLERQEKRNTQHAWIPKLAMIPGMAEATFGTRGQYVGAR